MIPSLLLFYIWKCIKYWAQYKYKQTYHKKYEMQILVF